MKKLFLEGVTYEKIGIQQFLGDWFEVFDVQDAGYFLGAKMIEELSHQYTIEEIDNLDLAKIELKGCNGSATKLTISVS